MAADCCRPPGAWAAVSARVPGEAIRAAHNRPAARWRRLAQRACRPAARRGAQIDPRAPRDAVDSGATRRTGGTVRICLRGAVHQARRPGVPAVPAAADSIGISRLRSTSICCPHADPPRCGPPRHGRISRSVIVSVGEVLVGEARRPPFAAARCAARASMLAGESARASKMPSSPGDGIQSPRWATRHRRLSRGRRGCRGCGGRARV